MSGPHFGDYHLMLDEQSGQIFAMTGVFAGRVPKVGHLTLLSMGEIARNQRIVGNDAPYGSICHGIGCHQWTGSANRVGVQAKTRADCIALRSGHTVGGMSEYDTDILVWSEHQAGLLRRVAAGEPVNEPLDWTNIIEEIGSVGSEQLHAVKSLLTQALVHMLKAKAWPLSRDVPHWQSEERRFRIDAADRYSPSMRPRIDLARIYRRALRIMPVTMDGQPPLPVPDVCTVTLDELLSEV
jgi:hypothetical protein